MRIFAIIAVLLFACASVSVSAISSALASGSVVALSQVDYDTASCPTEHTAIAKSSAFKPCAKRVNGQAIVCHFDSGLLFDCLITLMLQAADEHLIPPDTSFQTSVAWRHFRPPQLA